jgi:hypothetical protein
VHAFVAIGIDMTVQAGKFEEIIGLAPHSLEPPQCELIYAFNRAAGSDCDRPVFTKPMGCYKNVCRPRRYQTLKNSIRV